MLQQARIIFCNKSKSCFRERQSDEWDIYLSYSSRPSLENNRFILLSATFLNAVTFKSSVSLSPHCFGSIFSVDT